MAKLEGAAFGTGRIELAERFAEAKKIEAAVGHGLKPFRWRGNAGEHSLPRTSNGKVKSGVGEESNGRDACGRAYSAASRFGATLISRSASLTISWRKAVSSALSPVLAWRRSVASSRFSPARSARA